MNVMFKRALTCGLQRRRRLRARRRTASACRLSSTRASIDPAGTRCRDCEFLVEQSVDSPRICFNHR
jgi:hypothetical protein